MGVLLLDDPDRDAPFTTAEESLLRSFARHAALALKRVSGQSRLERRVALLQRRNDRLEAERDNLDRHARSVSERLERQTGTLLSEPNLRAGRELRRLLALPYAKAKLEFTRRYLIQVLCDANGDLQRASEQTGLPLERLIGWLDKLEIDPPEPETSDPSARKSRRWGSAARR